MSKYSSLFGGGADQSVALPEPEPVNASRYTLLFVDDEPGILKALTRVFEDENYRILTAGDGLEALKMLEQNDVQLVISDFMMPKMNGAQFLAQAKQKYPDMIRIMLTGRAAFYPRLQ